MVFHGHNRDAGPETDKSAVRARLYRLSLLAFVLSLVAGVLVVTSLQYYQIHDVQHLAGSEAGRHASLIQDRLQQSLSATFALAAVVRQGNGEVTDFERLAAEMLPLYPGVDNLQLAPGGVIRSVQPRAGNEKAIGHDILADPRRNREALLAIETRRLTLAGPFELIQGGEAIIGRFPVFLRAGDGSDKFWGFTNALIRIPTLLVAANLEELSAAGYRYELWRVHPDSGQRHIFAHSGDAPLSASVEHGIEVPNGHWILSIEPRDGWLHWHTLALQAILAVVFALAMAGLYFLFSRYALGLRLEALRKARELARVNERLACEMRERQCAQDELEVAHREWVDAFDAVRSLVFLHDDQYRVMRANRAYLEHAALPLEQVVGRPYWEVFPRGDGPLPGCRHVLERGIGGTSEDEVVLPSGRIYQSHGFSVSGGTRRYSIHILEDVTSEREAVNRIQHMAHHDLLTGLPNRLLFQDRCEQALHLVRRKGLRLAVMLLDLDHFKPVNDTLGHAVGDRVLREVAQRLQATLRRRSDTLSRVGGDEFAALLPEIGQPEDVAAVAEGFAAALRAPFVVDGREVRVGLSIGIALAPQDGDSLRHLMAAADAAMYAVKQNGRGGFSFAGAGADSATLRAAPPGG